MNLDKNRNFHTLYGSALLLTALLAACGGGDLGSASLPQSATAAAITSSGPGVTDTANCAVPYGQPEAEIVTLTSGAGAGLIGEAADVLNLCLLNPGAERLNWIDRTGQPRAACLIAPSRATASTPLPMIVFLQGSIFPAPPQLTLTRWVPLTETANLSGDPVRPGFILLVPIGRNTKHQLPYPDNYGLGWDNWYRNLDRSTPDLNLDVAAIDAFIGQVRARGIVDSNRLYLSGWSNGASMAQLYAMNTPEVAAAAVYSSPDPFRDILDSCAQTPFATSLTPLMTMQNACDIAGICQTGTAFHRDLAQRLPKLQLKTLILDGLKNEGASCQAACAAQTLPGNPIGVVNHLAWPARQNEAMFRWLREHPLSAKPQ